MPEVDRDQLAALRRLGAAFGPIEVIEVLNDDPAMTWQRRRPIGSRQSTTGAVNLERAAQKRVLQTACKTWLPPGTMTWTHEGSQMAGTDGGRLHGLVDEQTVYAALDAIDGALEQALTAPTERQQRWQLNQLRGLLLTLRSSHLSLEEGLRRLVRLLQTPMADR